MMTAAAIRVLIVEDHAQLRLVLRSVLRRYPRIEIIGEARNGEQACACIESLQPRLILMDINMPIMNGIDATRWITHKHPGVLVIGFTLDDDEATIALMKNAGACAVVNKDRVFEELYPVINEAVGLSEDKEDTKHVLMPSQRWQTTETITADAAP